MESRSINLHRGEMVGLVADRLEHVRRKRRALGYIAVPLFPQIVAVKARFSTLLACSIVFISCGGKGALRCKRLNPGVEYEPAAG